MDPATISALVRLGIKLTGAVVKIFRSAGQEATAAELEAILQRADATAQSIIDRADAELGTLPTPPPPTPPPPVDTIEQRTTVETLRRSYPAFMTPALCVQLLNAVCIRLNHGAAVPWVMQRAPYGVDEQWQGISLDRITDYRTVVRVLGQASAGLAVPEWTEVREGPHGAPVHVDWPLVPSAVAPDPDWEDS